MLISTVWLKEFYTHLANYTDIKPGLEQRYFWKCGAQGDGEFRGGKVLNSVLFQSRAPCLGEALGGADEGGKAKV